MTTRGTKFLLDLAADETTLAVDGNKRRVAFPAAAGAVVEVARHRMGTIIEMQRRTYWDVTANQARAVAESYPA